MVKTVPDLEDHSGVVAVANRHSGTRRLILGLVLVALGYNFLKGPNGLDFTAPLEFAWPSSKISVADVCVQPQPAAQPSNYSSLYSSPKFRAASAKRLSGAVQIPTMSFDDMGPVDTDERWAPFIDMHAYLRDTFPLLHKEAQLTVVGGYSLVYTIQGTSAELKPLMLMGHLDVVPSVTSLDRWTYPPFSGAIDDEWIYGRGSSDCKNNVIGIMTALEHLIKSNWTPHRTIILAFGQDEEISGARGATNINIHLESIYGKDGIAMIVDEGGMGLETRFGREFALPGLAEKGHINFQIEVDMLGGHSSVPSEHTSIGILSKIISSIEDSTVFQPHLETTSPIWGYLSCVAAHGTSSSVPSWIKSAISAKHPDLDAAARNFAATGLPERYLVQTSKAATISSAGIKSNALAESAVVTFNSRIDLFSNSEEVQQIFASLIIPIAREYNLDFQLPPGIPSPGVLSHARTCMGASAGKSIGNITFGWSEATNPSPITSSGPDSTAWKVFASSVQASFGENVIAAPSAMTGNTDTRFYWNLSRNIYRWSPVRTGTRLNAHTVDEMIMIDSHVDSIRFYTELILQADGIANDDGF